MFVSRSDKCCVYVLTEKEKAKLFTYFKLKDRNREFALGILNNHNNFT